MSRRVLQKDHYAAAYLNEKMRITTTIDDKIVSELMRLAETESKTEAVNRAVASFIRQVRVRSLRGKLDIPINDVPEAVELWRVERLASRDG